MKKLLFLALILFSLVMVLSSCSDHTHEYSPEWIKDANYHWQACNFCRSTRFKAKHDWNIVTTPSTCTEAGYDTKTCSTCGKVEVVEKPLEEHTWIIETISPTCQSVGYDFKTCQICGATDVDNAQPKADHDWQIVTTPPTCQTEGYDIKTCKTCGKVVIENEQPLAEHNWEVVTTPSTCQIAGYDTRTCQTCGKVVIENKQPLAEHHWKVVTTPSTCQIAGYDTRTCQTCGKVVIENKQPLVEHDWKVVTTPSTCAIAGYDTRSCQTCGTVVIENKEPLAEHNWKVVTTPSTCQIAGYDTWTCQTCGKVVIENKQPMLDHAYGSEYVNDAKSHWQQCTNCTAIKDKTSHIADETGYCAICKRLILLYEFSEDGNYIYFGEYPQTLKPEDVTITEELDERGYYLGSDGYYYAKVVADPDESGYKFSTGTTVLEGMVYYFKVEPIRWRILSTDGETALILCDSIIANRIFTEEHFIEYADTEIRAWLIETFYKTAFCKLQQEIILSTVVDNSAASTGNPNNSDDENTLDKVFLLSYKEITNSDYGFSAEGITDAMRQMPTSDYSRATGAYMSTESAYYGNGSWWTRSTIGPDGALGNFNYRFIGTDSGIVFVSCIDEKETGIVPALWIIL